jgi:radical SAM protein with 4Fe4S-binding SPASM domain
VYCVWELTLACDLGCGHCGSRAGRRRADELSTEACLAVVHQLAEVGVKDVVLIGGEAYLREDWDRIAAEITRCGMACAMTTGARGLDPSRIDRAAAAGVRRISISLDGLRRTHDAQRGREGSWQAAVEAARVVARSAIELSVNTQINRASQPELPALADLLVELEARAWQIQLTVAMGRAADRPRLLLQPYELLELFPTLVWIKQTKLDPAGIRLFPANNIGYFGPYERHLRFLGTEGAHFTGCPAGQWALGIEADGTLKGCPSLPTAAYAGGNLRDTPLRELLQAPALRSLAERTVADLWGFCRTCDYAETCRGGCSWTAHSLLGRPGNDPYCIHRAIQLASRGRRERVVKVAAAEGRPFDHGRFELVEERIEPQPIATLLRRPSSTTAPPPDASALASMLEPDELVPLSTAGPRARPRAPGPTPGGG